MDIQAFAQMRILEASSHLASFSGLLKEEKRKQYSQQTKVSKHDMTWITAVAVTAANAMLEACPTPYERRCLSQLLSAADFGDGGLAAIRFRKYYWKLQLAEPALQTGSYVVTNGIDLDDDSLLRELENSGQWEEARSWAGQLDLGSQRTSSALHHVTETQVRFKPERYKVLPKGTVPLTRILKSIPVTCLSRFYSFQMTFASLSFADNHSVSSHISCTSK